jgi:hypothetical protein
VNTEAHASEEAWASDNCSPIVEVFYLSGGEDPFVCGASGAVTCGVLQDIEETILEEPLDYFTKGLEGIYKFRCRHNAAQIGDEGRIEIPAHWELERIGYRPLADLEGTSEEVRADEGVDPPADTV